MNRIIVAIIAVILIIILLVCGVWFLQSSKKPYAGDTESIVVGVPSPVESSALIYIAEDQHFFADNGLNVTIKEYDTGYHAVNDMLQDKSPDIAVAAEYIIVENAFEQKKIYGIGAIAQQQIFYLIGRKDHGIGNISDLNGKKVGVAPGTISGFYFGRFLELHNMSLQDVTVVDVQPAQFDDAIANGSVDAIVVWGTYAETIEGRLGSNVIVWPEQSGQLVYWNAICSDDWAAQHPELISRFLKSLDEAANYAAYHPAEAKAILKERSHADDAYIETVWSNSQFSLSLDESLITAMEDEGRYMISNNLTTEKTIPDYRFYFYYDGLNEVKPGSVNIIH